MTSDEKSLPGLKKIGPYTLVHRLGRGASAEVWLGLKPDRTTVALKIAHGNNAMSRNRREGMLLRDLGHKYLVEMEDLADDGSWLALEFVDGNTAREWSRGRLIDEVIEMLAKLCEAVAHLHERGVVHGDLKPDNVMVDKESLPRLIDLGVATHTSDTAHTKGFRGTLGFAAPEQLLGEAVQPASDVYSLGVLAYHLIARQPPFRSEDPAALGWLPLHSLPSPPSSHRQHVPPALEQLILRMLARRPTARPQNAAEAAIEFRTCIGYSSRPVNADEKPRIPVLGMAAERESLRRWVVEVSDGKAVVGLIHGPRGSGRGTLISEAETYARREGLRALNSRMRGDAGPTRPWKELWDDLQSSQSCMTLDGDSSEILPLVETVIRHDLPALLLIKALRPNEALVSIGARPLSPSPLSLENVGVILDLVGEDRRRAKGVHHASRGLPSAVLGLVRKDPLPDDLSPKERALLRAAAVASIRVEKAARQLGMSEHALLDLAEPLLDRGLLTEVDEGSAFARPAAPAPAL